MTEDRQDAAEMSRVDMVRALRHAVPELSLRVAIDTVDAGWRPGAQIPRDTIESATAAYLAKTRVRDAAPYLLAALQETVTWIVELANSGDAGFWDPEKMPEVIQARAAIAKATGAPQ